MKIKLLLTPLFTALLFFQGCNPEPEGNASPESCTFNSNFSELTELAYHHVLYHQAVVDPYIYMPLQERAVFQFKFDSLRQVVSGLDFPAFLDHFRNEGVLSTGMVEYFTLLEQGFSDNFSQEKPMIEYLGLLDGFDTQIQGASGLACNEKEFILIVTSALRGYLQFMGTDEANLEFFRLGAQSRGCFWNWVGCFFETVIKDTLEGALIGAMLGLTKRTDHGEGGPNALSVVISGPLTTAGALIGLIVGIIHGAIDAGDCCPDEMDCRQAIGLSVEFIDCSDAAWYTAWGMGSDNVSNVWENLNGIPDLAVTSAPNRLFITQITPNVPVETQISSICADTSTNVSNWFLKNLTALVKEVSDFLIAGPADVEPGETYTYSIEGPAAYDGRHAFTLGVYKGTIISQSGNTVSIVWDTFEPGQKGELNVYATNSCPGGKSRAKKLYVLQGNMH